MTDHLALVRQALEAAREMLGVFEDNGGHDGLMGKGYVACLNQIDAALTALARPAPVEGEVETALNRYRYAIGWVAADSWDNCEECRARLEWARSSDPGGNLSDNQMGEIGRTYLRSRSRSRLSEKPASPAPSGASREEIEAVAVQFDKKYEQDLAMSDADPSSAFHAGRASAWTSAADCVRRLASEKEGG